MRFTHNKENESTNRNLSQSNCKKAQIHKLGCPLSSRKNQSILGHTKNRQFNMYSPQPISIKDYSVRELGSPKSFLSSKKIEASTINKLIQDIRSNQQQINTILNEQQIIWNSDTEISDFRKFQQTKSKLKKIKRLGSIINKVILRSKSNESDFGKQCSIEKLSYELQIAHQVIVELQEALRIKEAQIINIVDQKKQLEQMLNNYQQHKQLQGKIDKKLDQQIYEVQTYQLLSPQNKFQSMDFNKTLQICIPPLEKQQAKGKMLKIYKSLLKLTVYCLNSLGQFVFKQFKNKQLVIFEAKIKQFSQYFNDKYKSITDLNQEYFMRECKQKLQKIYNQLVSHIV